MGHQVGGQQVGGRHPRPIGDVVVERPGRAPRSEYRVEVALRVEAHGVAVLGEVDGQLRHPQQRFVEAHQAVLDLTILGAQGDPPAQTEVAIQPGVQQRPAVGLQPHHPPHRLAAIRALLDPQIWTVGVGADDPERLLAARCVPGDQ